MNVHAPTIGPAERPSRDEAATALDTLRAWASSASDAELARLGQDVASLVAAPPRGNGSYPDFARSYEAVFQVTDAYRASLPDLQNGPESLIKGVHTRIQHVGISGFRLPLPYTTCAGEVRTLETKVTGTVSLEAEKKGINMSRIMRSFYATAGSASAAEGWGIADQVLDAYLRDLGSFDARLSLALSYPMEVPSLRSGLAGWQYYDVVLEVVQAGATRQHILHLDYVYSSTCPCSLELSEHARSTRGRLATPHSQRSVARLSVVLEPGSLVPIEDLVEACRAAVPTETQVMVKREDEQAFAELNASNPIFVEDAARLFASALLADQRVGDFRIVASHQESLHSHDAVSVLTEGPTFASGALEPHLFASLIHRG